MIEKTDWYLIPKESEESEDRQILYEFELPTFKFEGKKVHWKPISIELPTRQIEWLEKWVISNDPKNLNAVKFSGNFNKPVEKWHLANTKIKLSEVRKGRKINIKVDHLVLEYDWAGKVK